MLYRLRFLLLLPLAAILACASSAPIPGGGPTPTGDYVLSVSPSGVTPFNFTGNLSVQGLSVSGVLRYNNPGSTCVAASQDIPFSGTISNAVLTLTSGAFSNSIATLKIPLPLTTTSSGTEISNGTAVIAGGSCVLASSPLQVTYVPSFGQNFSGLLTGPASGTLSLSVTQSTANADGQFPVVAAVSFAGAGCNFSLSGVTGLVSGYTLSLGPGQTAPNNEVSIMASSTTSPITVSMNVFAGLNCPVGQYSGTLQ